LLKKNHEKLYHISFIASYNGSASAHELSGTVVDEDNVPIDGVGVFNKTTGGYSYTNIAG
jgi:hypothetical protein